MINSQQHLLLWPISNPTDANGIIILKNSSLLFTVVEIMVNDFKLVLLKNVLKWLKVEVTSDLQSSNNSNTTND